MNHPYPVLENHFRLYQRHLREEAWYSAAVALAEIFQATASLPAEQRTEWQSRLNEELTDTFVQEVRIGQDQTIKRIHRVLSVGSEWTGEEILLVMLYRIDVEIIFDFLGSAAAVESMVHLKHIDDQLSTLEKSKNHAPSFRWSLQRMKKVAVFDVERVWVALMHGNQS